ncbi:TRAP transporter substrate-binding protein [uncultured Imperialibacter sp.]|uniref:TRAP transporter substrate-binding protein n=1 Tax=uncultured Imperialibacter sp. TaxID=1672639 RepID=UPI0030DD9B45|tara:strand:+ start:20407 stop:21528 length:1122 start_codon:yes stop_codon:yes gene_type:complete
MEINRREFLAKGGLGLAGGTVGLLSACTEEKKQLETPYINFNKLFEWKMVTTWPPNFPVVGEGCVMMAKWVETMSGGRLKIKVYGGGELVPSLEVFDAVSSGAVEIGHGASYYWAGKVQAAQFFAAVPFGMNAQQMNAWIISSGSIALWEELYEPFRLLPMIAGNTGVQMAGWFNRELNTMDDLKGLKMRIPGLGGKVLSEAGGTSVLQAGGEIYTNLERGVIDAAEWIGPYHDYLMGFQRVAKHYYYPGWHEPGSVLEQMVNKDKFEALPTDLKEIVRAGASKLNEWMLAEFDAKNSLYLKKLREEEGTDIRKLPDVILRELKKISDVMLGDMAQGDPIIKKVYDSFTAFRDQIKPWSDISERAFYNDVLGQ